MDLLDGVASSQKQLFFLHEGSLKLTTLLTIYTLFISTANASQLSCETVITFDAIQRFGAMNNGYSLDNDLVTIAQSEDSILFEGTLRPSSPLATEPPQTIYITATKVEGTCTDVKYLFPSVAE